MEKIGLEAVFADKGFQAGIAQYDAAVVKGTTVTTAAAKTISKSGGAFSTYLTQGLGGAFPGLYQEMDKLTASAQGLSIAQEAASGSGRNWLLTIGQLTIGLVSMAAGVAAAILQLGEAGTYLTRLDESFATTAEAAGMSANRLLSAMKEASGGLIRDSELMRKANRLMASGIQVSSDDMVVALELARLKAHQFGLTTEQAFTKIIESSQRGAVRGLKSLGIYVSAAEALDQMAASADGVETESEAAARAQAIWNAVIATGREQLEKFGRVIDDDADKIEQMHIATGELKETWQRAIAPAAADVAEAIAEGIPIVTNAANQIVSLAEAGMAWVGAALSGTDATTAFNRSLANATGWTRRLNEEYTDYWQRQNQVTVGQDHWNALLEESIPLLEGAARAAAQMVRSSDIVEMTRLQVDWEQKSSAAVAKAAEKMVDVEERAASQRRRAREQLIDSLNNLEESHAEKVADLQGESADAAAKLARDITQAERDAARDQEKVAQDLADRLVEIDRRAAQRRKEAKRELNWDLADLERDLQRTLADLEDELQRDQTKVEEEFADKETDIREAYKEARIQELIRAGGDEQEIREHWTDAMMAGPLKDQMEGELAALKEKRDKKLAELQAEYEAERQEQIQAYEREREDRKREYERRLEEIREQKKQEKEEARRAANERLAQIDEQLAAEKQRLEQAAQENQKRLERQLAEEQVNYQKRHNELQAHYTQQLAEVNRGLKEQQAEISRSLGLELRAILEALGMQSTMFATHYADELAKLDAYLAERLAKEAQYQQDLKALWGEGSPSRWMEQFAANLQRGFLRGWQAVPGLEMALTKIQPNLMAEQFFTAATQPAGGRGVSDAPSVTVGPNTINNGMDLAHFRAIVTQIVSEAVRYG